MSEIWTVEDVSAWEAANEVAYLSRAGDHVLRLTGEDRVGFLQRQSTHNIMRLGPNRPLLTVLTSPTARIIDVLWLVDRGDAIDVLALPERAESTRRYLKGRIFFMDRVAVEEPDPPLTWIEVVGERAGEVLGELGLTPPAHGECAVGAIAGTEATVLAHDHVLGWGYRIVFPIERLHELIHTLHELHVPAIPASTYQVLRIERGLPGHQAELTEEYTPLEVGLRSFVSENKGCYTGQEVIARQLTYDKVTRQLVGLRLSEPAAPGSRVLAEGSPVGVLTSVAVSPQLGPIALAVLRRPHHEPGTQVVIEGGGAGTVSPLPFGA